MAPTAAPAPTVIAYASRPDQLYVAEGDGSYRHLGYTEWRNLGSPAPTTLEIKFLSSPWDSTVRRAEPGGTSSVSYADWKRAGSPSPVSAWTGTVKVSWSSTVYGLLAFTYSGQTSTAQPLTLSQWRKVGSPNPSTVGHVHGSSYYKWASNGDEIFVETPDRAQHKLSYGQWRNAASPSPAQRAGGYLTVSWTSTVWFYDNISSGAGGRVVSYADWTGARSPKPRTVGSVPGGEFYQYWGTTEIRYRAHGADSYVTPAGWASAGRPKPRTEYAPVFAYGTLRPGQSNWGVVSQYVVSTRHGFMPGTSLYEHPSGRYPYMVSGGAGTHGDVLTLDPNRYAAAIARLDKLENYDPSRPPQSQNYYRALVTLADGTRAMTYLTSDRQSDYIRKAGRLIPSGDWTRR